MKWCSKLTRYYETYDNLNSIQFQSKYLQHRSNTYSLYPGFRVFGHDMNEAPVLVSLRDKLVNIRLGEQQ